MHLDILGDPVRRVTGVMSGEEARDHPHRFPCHLLSDQCGCELAGWVVRAGDRALRRRGGCAVAVSRMSAALAGRRTTNAKDETAMPASMMSGQTPANVRRTPPASANSRSTSKDSTS